MLNINEIRAAIDELERAESSFPAYAKLAHLYTILDHNAEPRREKPKEEQYSLSAPPTEIPDSDFLRVANRLDYDKVLAVIDDLMDTLKTVQPNVYSAVMRQLIQP